MAGLEKRVKFHPSERVDGEDAAALSQWATDRISEHNKFLFTQLRKVVSGFRLKYDPGVDGLRLTVVNGSAIDSTGEIVHNKELENIERTVTLVDGQNFYFIGIQFRLADAESDARAFWDQTVDNGSGNPPGREFSRNVPTRFLEDWQVVATPSSTDVLPDAFKSQGSVVIPIGKVRTTGGAITFPDGSSTTFSNDPTTGNLLFAKSVVVQDLTDASTFQIQLSDTVHFPDSGYIDISLPTDDQASSSPEQVAFTNNNRSTGVLTLATTPVTDVLPGAIVRNVDNAGDVIREFIPIDDPYLNLRDYLFKAKRFTEDPATGDYHSFASGSVEFEDYLGKALVQAELPFSVDGLGGRTSVKTSPLTWEDRGEEHIKDLYDQLEVLKHQVKEIKFGQSAFKGDSANKPDGYVSDLRATTAAGASLRESIADYVTIGMGPESTPTAIKTTSGLGNSFGYFNVSDYTGAAPAATAFNRAIAALPDTGGVVFVKRGTYDLVTTLVSVTKPVVFQGASAEAVEVLSNTTGFSFAADGVGTEFRDMSFRKTAENDNPFMDVDYAGIAFRNCSFGSKKPEGFSFSAGDWVAAQMIKIDPWSGGKLYKDSSKPVVIDGCTFYNSTDPEDTHTAGSLDRDNTVYIGDGHVRITDSVFYHYQNRTIDYTSGTIRDTSEVSNICIENTDTDSSVIIDGCKLYGGRASLDSNLGSMNVTASNCYFGGVSAIYDSGTGVTVDGSDTIRLQGLASFPGTTAWTSQYLVVMHHRAHSWAGDFTVPTPEKDTRANFPYYVVRINEIADVGGTAVDITAANYEIVFHSDATGTVDDFSDSVGTSWYITDIPPANNCIRTGGAGSDWTVSNCNFATFTHFGIIARADDTTITGCSFDGEFLPSGAHVPLFLDTGAVSVDSCYFVNFRYQAIRVDDGAVPATISDCHFNANQAASLDIDSGVAATNTISDKCPVVGVGIFAVTGSEPVRLITTNVSSCKFFGDYYVAVGATYRDTGTSSQLVQDLQVKDCLFGRSGISESFLAIPVGIGFLDGAGVGTSVVAAIGVSVTGNNFRCDNNVHAAIAFYSFDGEGRISDSGTQTGYTSPGLVKYTNISNNVIKGSTTRPRYGVLLEYLEHSDAVISDNNIALCENAGVAFGQLYAGDFVTAPASTSRIGSVIDSIVSGNQITDVNNSGTDPTVGIYVGPCDNEAKFAFVNIVDNYISEIGTSDALTHCSGITLRAKSPSGGSVNANALISGNSIYQIGNVSNAGLVNNLNAGINEGPRGTFGIACIGPTVQTITPTFSVHGNKVTRVFGRFSDASPNSEDVLEAASLGRLNSGILIWSGDQANVKDNTVTDIIGTGIAVAASSLFTGPAIRDVVIRGNTINQCSMSGLESFLPSAGNGTDPTTGSNYVLPGVVVTTDKVDSTVSLDMVSISNNHLRGSTSKWMYALDRDFSTHDHTHVLNKGSAGILLHGRTFGGHIEGNHVGRHRLGIRVSPVTIGASDVTTRIKVSGNNVWTSAAYSGDTDAFLGGAGIYVGSTEDGAVPIITQVDVSNNTVTSHFTPFIEDTTGGATFVPGAVTLSSCDYYSVYGNNISQAEDHGDDDFMLSRLFAAGSVAGLSITGNVSTDCNNGAVCMNRVDLVNISGVTASDDTRLNYGIYFRSGADNHCFANTVTGIANLKPLSTETGLPGSVYEERVIAAAGSDLLVLGYQNANRHGTRIRGGSRDASSGDGGFAVVGYGGHVIPHGLID